MNNEGELEVLLLGLPVIVHLDFMLFIYKVREYTYPFLRFLPVLTYNEWVDVRILILEDEIRNGNAYIF